MSNGDERAPHDTEAQPILPDTGQGDETDEMAPALDAGLTSLSFPSVDGIGGPEAVGR